MNGTTHNMNRRRVGNRALRGDIVRSDAGASALEFALVAPILLALLFGMIEFGFAFQAQLAVTHAAREGARMAAVLQNPADWDPTIVEDRAFPLTFDDGLTVDRTFPDARSVSVTVGFPYQWQLLPLNDSIELMSTATMRLE